MGTDNCASRLAAILEQARQQPNRPAIEVWMEIFGVPERLDLLQKSADLAKLVEQVETEVRALPEDEDPDHLLAYLSQIRTCVDGLLYVGNVPMDHFIKQISGEAIYSLESCSRALRRNRHVEPLISAESSRQLVEDVRAIIDDVISSVLPDDLKELLVNRLRGVEAALLNVRISGYAGVEKAMDALTFGAMRATPPDSKERAKAGGWLGRLWAKLSEHAQGAQAISATAAQSAEFIKSISGG